MLPPSKKIPTGKAPKDHDFEKTAVFRRNPAACAADEVLL